MNSLVDDRDRELLHRLYEPPLLVSDSQRSFNSVRDAVLQQIAPRDFVEHMLATELINGEWETLQQRGFKTLIVTAARLPALKKLLTVLFEDSARCDIRENAEHFFTNKAVRKRVGKLLRSYGLTEANIDAEAFRRSIGDLAQINRRLAELASRRDKILYLLEEHRAGLASPCPPEPGEVIEED